MSEFSLRVARRVDEADDVVSFTLVDPMGGDLPAWSPGAHIDVVVPCIGSRQYSLCGDPRNRQQYRIAVLRELAGRGGSNHLHDKVQTGDLLEIHGPRNHFVLDEAPHYVFLAGGIGVTPILTMAADAERRGVSWSMVYGGRTRSTMAFVDELPAGVRLVPEDEVGRIDVAAALRDLPPGALVYCCGPAPLITAVREHGAEAVRFELFAAPETEDAPAERAFAVTLARTGVTLTVAPGETILDKAIEAGADLGFNCQDGICGSCETSILEGRAEHRDHVLTDQEKAEHTCLMVCVSRAEGARLVLDL
ncbi:PDR/VanB family oxidoreductase [Pseudonocardia sp. GCM10023141]|uniref:PDR/VanB family oxidoreductase n=1 Tax=Pseudonocardia sp. GCM10023141 TaxID=3252653 RepID=UPI00360C4FBE